MLTGGLSGYLFTPAGAGAYPTILHIDGYDGTAEELYASAPAALDRGYAFAAIDGPGQGATLYDKRVPMRSDWEEVVPEMFDALAAEPEVDAQRIVLVGRSFGGVIAPRGAAGEHRLAAMIVDPGQFEMGPALLKDLGPLADDVHDPAADEQFQQLLDQPQMKAFLAPRMTTHGVSTVRAYCEDMLRYSPISVFNTTGDVVDDSGALSQRGLHAASLEPAADGTHWPYRSRDQHRRKQQAWSKYWSSV